MYNLKKRGSLGGKQKQNKIRKLWRIIIQLLCNFKNNDIEKTNIRFRLNKLMDIHLNIFWQVVLVVWTCDIFLRQRIGPKVYEWYFHRISCIESRGGMTFEGLSNCPEFINFPKPPPNVCFVLMGGNDFCKRPL